MRNVVVILASLTIAVALSPELAAEPPQFTPEQHELAGEVLGGLNEVVSMALFPFFGSGAESHAVDIDFDETWEEWSDEAQAMLRIELLFARRVCGLTEAEVQQLSLASEAAMKERLKSMMLRQLEPDENEEESFDESNFMWLAQASMSQAAECLLTPSQVESLATERQKRATYRKRVTIHNLLVRLDEDLRLSPDQRDKFLRLFERNWQESWSQSLVALSSDGDFMPQLPEAEVFGILSAAQREAFKERSFGDNGYGWDSDPLGLFAEQELVEMAGDEEPVRDQAGKSADEKRSDD